MAAKKKSSITPRPAPPLPGTPELPAHALKYLTSRAITSEAATAAGIRYLTAQQRREEVGPQQRVTGEDDSDAIYIPYPRTKYKGGPKFTVRALHPSVAQPKFKGPPGMKTSPYWSPLDDWDTILGSTEGVLNVCEGPVKALAMSLAGYPSMAVNGTHGWMRGKQMVDELRAVDWTDRTVVLSPDNDVHSKVSVQGGWGGLAEALAERGATVFYRLIPLGEDGAKYGPDDYLKKFGRRALAALELVPWDDERFADWGVPLEIAALNERHAIITVGKRALVYIDDWTDRSTAPMYSVLQAPDFKLRYGNQKVNTGVTDPRTGNPILKPLGEYWLTHRKRRDITRMTFDPTRPWGLSHQHDSANLWPGFGYEPIEPNANFNWTKLKAHIRDNICGGNGDYFKYVMGWMAFGVQRMTERPGVALVLTGGEGNGKGTFARAYVELFGAAGIHVQKTKDLMGNFNGHLASKVAVFADEALFAKDHRIINELKGLITEPTRTIEAKFQEAITVPNYTRLIIASNEDHVIGASLDARRFAVFRLSDEHKQDSDYFAAISKQLRNGGYGAMLYELMHHDLAGFDISKFPRTAELGKQQEDSMPLEERWWLYVLREGCQTTGLPMRDTSRGWEALVSTRNLRDSIINFARSDKYAGDLGSSAGSRLTKIMRRYSGDSRCIHPAMFRTVDGQQCRGWHFASHEACVEEYRRVTNNLIEIIPADTVDYDANGKVVPFRKQGEK